MKSGQGNPITPILYSRPGCHLCDYAEEMLREEGIAWTGVNIDSDPALSDRYGLRIPVLLRPDIGVELDWPFMDDDVHELLERSS
jgi:hypothetical protein